MVLNFLNYCTFTILFCLLLFWLQGVLLNLLNHFIWLTTFSWRWIIIFATECTDVLIYSYSRYSPFECHYRIARRHLQADAPEAEDDGARGDPEREPETSAGAAVASGAVHYRASAGLFVLSALTRRRVVWTWSSSLWTASNQFNSFPMLLWHVARGDCTYPYIQLVFVKALWFRVPPRRAAPLRSPHIVHCHAFVRATHWSRLSPTAGLPTSSRALQRACLV